MYYIEITGRSVTKETSLVNMIVWFVTNSITKVIIHKETPSSESPKLFVFYS